MRRWGLSITCAVMALAFGASAFAKGEPLAAVIVIVFFLIAAVLVSPRAFPRSVTAAEARSRSAADGRAIVFWRPGCPFCIRLRTSLGRDAARLHWVDIWSDPDGAAAVRAVADGNETVPTVIAGADSWVNPAPAFVRQLTRSSS